MVGIKWIIASMNLSENAMVTTSRTFAVAFS